MCQNNLSNVVLKILPYMYNHVIEHKDNHNNSVLDYANDNDMLCVKHIKYILNLESIK
jgi:hypothetical protein